MYNIIYGSLVQLCVYLAHEESLYTVQSVT